MAGASSGLSSPDRQLANPRSGDVINRLGDGRISADIALLAQAFDPELVDQSVLFGDEDDFGRIDIGICRDQVFVPGCDVGIPARNAI